MATGHLWNITTPRTKLADTFINNNVPFNLYKNIILPHVGIDKLIYLACLGGKTTR